MRNVAENFKIDICTYGRQFDFKIKVNDADFNVDNLNYINPAFNTPLFKTVMHQVEIDSKLYMPKDTKVYIKVGVKVNEKNYNYVELGTFYVKCCERQEDTNSYRILAYTKMKNAMIDYDLTISENITVRNYLIAICERLGWNTENIPATFINSTKLINPLLHTGIGYTFRDALDEIATITCSFLLFKNDDFYLSYLTNTNQTIDESYLDEDNITIGEKYLINSLVFSRAEESDNIYRKDDNSIETNGLHEYRISDCQLLSTNDRDNYIDEMFNYLKTLEFYIFDIQSKGILFLEACDMFNLVLNGVTYPVALLNNEINIEDGLTENLYMDEPEETETEYKYADSTDKKINQTYILVDKQNQEITQVVQTTTTLEKEITDITTTEATAKGKNIHIEDSAEEPLVDIVVKGETKQEGTPTPDEPIEIENVEGKNLFNKDTMAMIYARYISTTNEWKASDDSASVLFPCKPNKIYTISHSCKNVTLFKCGYIKENKENITQDTAISVYNAFLGTTQLSHTIKTGEGATYIIIQISLSYMDEVIETLQIEEGTVATEYVPYNSLEFEVVGKNELYVQDISENTALGTTVSSKNGVITLNGTSTTSFREIKWNSFQTNQSGNYTFSIEASGYADKENDNCALILQVSDNNSNFTALRELNLKSTTLKEYTVTLDTSKYYRLRLYIPKETAFNNVTMKAQLEYGSEATDYEPYKSQTEYFPLAEGQKLYEGSYLADDGIHNKRKQYVITGQEDWFLGTQYRPEYGTRFDCNITTYPMAGKLKVLCTHYKSSEANKGGCWANNEGRGNYLQLRIQDNISTVDELKTYLQEQYSNGTPVIVEYELAEEEIIPYTEEQQEAWDKIKELYTYKNITNITSTADLDIVYVRDNGLSDMYETKQNANKRYAETTEKFAETKMTTDSIQDTVSKTETTVANNYDELKTKFNDYAPKSDIITIQNSVEKIQTDTYTKTEINTKLTDGSVTKVQTTAGTFDDNGLTIEKTNAKTKGNFNEKGITVMDATSGSEEELLFAGYDEELSETIVRTKNINVEKYLTKCNIAREEAYTNPVLGGKGIGVFSL